MQTASMRSIERSIRKARLKVEKRRTLICAALALCERGEYVTYASLSKEAGIPYSAVRNFFRTDSWLFHVLPLKNEPMAKTRARCLKARRILEFRKQPVTTSTIANQLGVTRQSLCSRFKKNPELKVELGLTKARIVGRSIVFPCRRLRM